MSGTAAINSSKPTTVRFPRFVIDILSINLLFPLFHFSTFQLRISPMRLAMLLLILVALQSVVASQAPSADRAANPGRLRELIPGHYVYSTNNEGRLFNSGIVATSEGVVVFDSLDSDVIARAERQAIADVV